VKGPSDEKGGDLESSSLNQGTDYRPMTQEKGAENRGNIRTKQLHSRKICRLRPRRGRVPGKELENIIKGRAKVNEGVQSIKP